MVPSVVCRGRRVVSLRGAVYGGGEDPSFPGQLHRGAYYVLADPRGHKRIGRGVCNFDNATSHCVRKDAVLAGTFANFS